MHRDQRTVALMLIMSLLAWPSVARCTDEDEPKSEPKELLVLFQSWNENNLQLKKEDFTGLFMEDLGRLSEGKPGEWLDRRKRIWTELPNELSMKLPLSKSGQTLLVSLFAENETEFRRVGDRERADRLLKSKLFLILSLSQEHAIKAKSSSIRASHAFIAIGRAWTGLWPFCPRESISPEVFERY